MAHLAAKALFVLHLLWVLFMLLGFPVALFWRLPRVRWVHALGLGFYILLALLGWYCPLTLGEEYFRQIQTPSFSYQGSFLVTWIERIIYVENWGGSLTVFRVLAGLYLAVCVTSWWWLPADYFQRKKTV